MRSLFLIALFALPLAAQQAPAPPAAAPKPCPQLNEITNFKRFTGDNDRVGPPGTQRVVFMGDSITDFWGRKSGEFFPGKPYLNRGISGQTTAQMLLRFQPDVVDLSPAAVVILAGTNDVAENSGPYTDAQIEGNIKSMVAIALQNHIRVILGSIPPAGHFPWKPAMEPAARIRTLNAWMKTYAADNHLVYLDYYSAMATPEGAMQPNLAEDKFVHPNEAGYAVMQPLAEAAIAQSLATKAP